MGIDTKPSWGCICNGGENNKLVLEARVKQALDLIEERNCFIPELYIIIEDYSTGELLFIPNDCWVQIAVQLEDETVENEYKARETKKLIEPFEQMFHKLSVDDYWGNHANYELFD